MKLDMRQTIVESCALDGEGNFIKWGGGAEHERAKAGAPTSFTAVYDQVPNTKSLPPFKGSLFTMAESLSVLVMQKKFICFWLVRYVEYLSTIPPLFRYAH